MTRPIIEHVVKEAIAAGITEIILVTRSVMKPLKTILMPIMS
jgi:UTP-glucose-1-phosphate uridylyltransferase